MPMRCRTALVLCLGLAAGLPAGAQSPPDPASVLPSGPAGEVVVRLLKQVQTSVAATERYRSKLLTASPEDSVVLRLQLFARVEGGLRGFYELVDALLALEKTGEQTVLRQRVEAICAYIAPGVWRLIADLRGEIDVLRARRASTAPADRSELEDRIIRISRRLDTVYQLGWTHLAKMAALGQDTTADRSIFVSLVADRADELSGRLALGLMRAEELAGRLKETPGNADVSALSIAVRKSIDNDTRSQEVMIALLDAAGRSTEEYRAQLITVTQDFSVGLLNAQVTASLVRRAWTQVTDWLVETGPKVLVKLVVVLAILLGGRLVAEITRRVVARGLRSAKVRVSELLRRTLVSASFNVMMALAAIVALGQFGVSLGPVLAGLGVVGFILGFAMQDSLSNLAAGMMILINRPYDIGDFVELTGVYGKVEAMSLVSTSILTADNQKLVVPNSKIWGDVIKNVTDQKTRRVDLVFGISYHDDITRAEAVLADILASDARVLADPPPLVRLHELGDSAVHFVVRPWVRTEHYWDVFWDVTRAVKLRFDQEGISIPFPQRDVHVYTEPGDRD